MNDITKASILVILWVCLFIIASVVNNTIVWLLFFSITVIEAIYLYFDYINEEERKRYKKKNKLLSKQTKEYIEYVRNDVLTKDQEENT